jgi:hypothetical protein
LRQIFVPTIEIISYGPVHHADYRDITFHSQSKAPTTMESSNNSSSMSVSPSSFFSTDDIPPGAFGNESAQTTLTTPSLHQNELRADDQVSELKQHNKVLLSILQQFDQIILAMQYKILLKQDTGPRSLYQLAGPEPRTGFSATRGTRARQ